MSRRSAMANLCLQAPATQEAALVAVQRARIEELEATVSRLELEVHGLRHLGPDVARLQEQMARVLATVQTGQTDEPADGGGAEKKFVEFDIDTSQAGNWSALIVASTELAAAEEPFGASLGAYRYRGERLRSRAELRALKRGHLGACSVRRDWYRSYTVRYGP